MPFRCTFGPFLYGLKADGKGLIFGFEIFGFGPSGPEKASLRAKMHFLGQNQKSEESRLNLFFNFMSLNLIFGYQSYLLI